MKANGTSFRLVRKVILSIYRDLIYRDCTLGLMVCGQDSFFCCEHTLLSGKQLRATRAGQYSLKIDLRGLWFSDDQERQVRIQAGSDIRRYREPVILVGANMRENRLYDTTLAMDRLMFLMANTAKLSQFQIELRDPQEIRYGEEGGKPWLARWG